MMTMVLFLVTSSFALAVGGASASGACGAALVERNCQSYCYDPSHGWGFYCTCEYAVDGHCVYDDHTYIRIIIGAVATTLP
jgi:hypothetical protein